MIIKTFKLASLAIKSNLKYEEIPFQDGLAINTEQDDEAWIIELLLKKETFQQYEMFLCPQEPTSTFLIQITSKKNEPAYFRASFRKKIADAKQVSLLYDGRVKKREPNFATEILHRLIDDGHSGAILKELFEAHTQPKEETDSK